MHTRVSLETSTCEVLCDVARKLAADFVCDNGVIEVSLLHDGEIRFRLGLVTAKPLAHSTAR